MRVLIRALALCVGVIVATSLSAADAPPTIKYLHLYADSKGISHFKEEQLTFSEQPGRTGGPMSHPLVSAQGATFLRLKSGAVEDWHTAPRRWFLIAVRGISEVTAADGEVRRLTPGTIMLMDDTTGKGHITKAIGPEEHVAVVIPVTDVPGLEKK